MLHIAEKMLASQNYRLDDDARTAMEQYITARRTLPHSANARPVRNALDRARLRQADRLFNKAKGPIDADRLSLIAEPNIRASRVFRGGRDMDRLDAQGANRQSAAERLGKGPP